MRRGGSTPPKSIKWVSPYGSVVAQSLDKRKVVGSIPTTGTK